MRRVSVEDIRPGMYLSRALFAPNGNILLHEGVEVKDRYIAYLRRLGYTHLYLDDEETSDVVVEDIVPPELRAEAVKTAHEIVGRFQGGDGIELDRIKLVVSQLIENISSNPDRMVHFLDIRRKNDYLLSHSVNTCILSILTAANLSYSAAQMEEIGLAAMFHDIGKIKLRAKLAQRYPGKLTGEDDDEYKRHPFYSAEILKKNTKLPPSVALTCLQHHERWNGSGYPLGLDGEDITPYAQILHVADVYDTLTSDTRRRPTPVYYAVAILKKAAGEYFNPDIVQALTRNVAVYPLGTSVRLNNNQIGVIVDVDKETKTTPVVRIIQDEYRSTMNSLVELDLNKNPELFIVDFL